MAEIVLATLNAKYIHAGFGLRYLMANLGELRPRARLLEFDIHQRALDIVQAAFPQAPSLASGLRPPSRHRPKQGRPLTGPN